VGLALYLSRVRSSEVLGDKLDAVQNLKKLSMMVSATM
jgi:hypothetical protein